MMSEQETITDSQEAVVGSPDKPGLRKDLAVLMKVRLNFFVLITALFGFLLASRGDTTDWA